jgi:hypothetical protein
MVIYVCAAVPVISPDASNRNLETNTQFKYQAQDSVRRRSDGGQPVYYWSKSLSDKGFFTFPE